METEFNIWVKDDTFNKKKISKKKVASLLSDEIHEMTYHIHPVTDRAY